MGKIRGRPFESGNKFGRGRPKGSRNKLNSQAKELLQEFSVLLLKTMIKKAADGDIGMLKTLAPHIFGKSDELVKIGTLRLGTIDDVTRSSAKIARMAAQGKISPSQALSFTQILEEHRRILETRDIEHRLEAVERNELPKSSFPAAQTGAEASPEEPED